MQVPKGTKENFCRPWRDFCIWLNARPSTEVPGYFQNAGLDRRNQIAAGSRFQRCRRGIFVENQSIETASSVGATWNMPRLRN